MPYEVVKDENACSASKPWAVKKVSDGEVMGCHETKSDAKDQQSALYANETDAAAQAAIYAAVGLTEIGGVVIPEGVDVYLTTVPNVPLFEMGMDFPASTGVITFTDKHLSASVAASHDPTLPRARVKLGHCDPRFNGMQCPNCLTTMKPMDENDTHYFDGTPAFGFVENMRLGNDGGIVYGDLVSVPEWLAAVMPVAWPSRSIEGWTNFKSPSQKEWAFAMSAVALLGVMWPAILSLDDLPLMYGKVKPDFVEIAA